ncbi:MAG: sulfonate transport system permease protein [Actinomycetota bacterium]|jgi:sulfonate transport system permease protein|nr:sulfonate transport system permease protein [Actinomycetota bacterium]
MSGPSLAGIERPGFVTLGGFDAAKRPTRRRRHSGAERLFGVVLLIGAWQLASTVGLIDAQTLAGPSTVVRSGWHLIQDGTLQSAVWVSLRRVVEGVAIGVPIATLLALISGLSRLGENTVDAPMQMLRFLPIIGLQPLIVLWFGIGNTAKVSLIVLGVVFPVYINAFAAIRAIDPRHFELAQTVGLGRFATIRRVVLPGALPGFLVGLRLAAAVAWLILVFAEQINATNGVGFLMIRAQEFFQTDIIVVGLAVYATLGLVSDSLVRLLERRALQWRASR